MQQKAKIEKRQKITLFGSFRGVYFLIFPINPGGVLFGGVLAPGCAWGRRQHSCLSPAEVASGPLWSPEEQRKARQAAVQEAYLQRRREWEAQQREPEAERPGPHRFFPHNAPGYMCLLLEFIRQFLCVFFFQKYMSSFVIITPLHHFSLVLHYPPSPANAGDLPGQLFIMTGWTVPWTLIVSSRGP